MRVKKEDINEVLDKAIEFYASKEDYDLCQIVKNLKQFLVDGLNFIEC